MTPEEEKAAREIVQYLEERFPDNKWEINSRDDLLTASAYLDTL